MGNDFWFVRCSDNTQDVGHITTEFLPPQFIYPTQGANITGFFVWSQEPPVFFGG
jgi:hypothetical protein